MVGKEVRMIKRPNAVGLLLCEHAVIEEKTRNVSLVNTFGRLRFREFPSPPRRFVAFALLTDGLGQGTLTLVHTRLETSEDLNRYEWPAKFVDPLHQVRAVMRLPTLSFPAEGRYQFSLLADGEWVAQCLVHVSLEVE